MIKTTEMVKAKGSTMFFPKIIVTQEELERMCNNQQINLCWIRFVVKNYEEFGDLAWKRRYRKQGVPSKDERYKQLVEEWSKKDDQVLADTLAFSRGELDLIDLVVAYGIDYKKCRQFAKDVFAKAGRTVDVDNLWKQHKKYSQKQTTITLYGVAHTALRPEVQAKRQATNRERYGVDNPMYLSEFKEQVRQHTREKFGVDYAFQREHIHVWQKKLFDTLTKNETWKQILQDLCEKQGADFAPSLFDMVLPVSRRDFVISELSNTHVEDLLRLWMEQTGERMIFPENALFHLPFAFSKTWLSYYDKLGLLSVPELYYQNGSSIYEKRIADLLDQAGIPYLRNHKKALQGMEMDFYISEKQIGIEVNPNVSHNSNRYATEPTRSMFDSHKEPSYHYEKYRTAKEAGITLIQLFSNDLADPVFEQVTAPRLLSLLKGYEQRVSARKVTVRKTASERERKEVRQFLEQYHSQGCSRAQEYWILEQDRQILGAASFVPRKQDMELKRLCFKPGIQIIGGLSKLISHYFREHPECRKIYSYSDNSLGNGLAYGKAGARFVKETGPALKFISPKDGRDSYSWQIATSWGASTGVVGKDAGKQGLPKPDTQAKIDRYIETTLSHRSDDCKGYDRIYTPGSKLWVFERKE